MICFLDKPILSGFGSSTYVSAKREEVLSHLAEMIEAIHADHGPAGIHCCSNTEWSILIDTGVDIVNFDAFRFGKTIAMYPDVEKKHLDRGGILAWGVVPTSKEIRNQSTETLISHFENMMNNLASRGIDKLQIAEQEKADVKREMADLPSYMCRFTAQVRLLPFHLSQS